MCDSNSGLIQFTKAKEELQTAFQPFMDSWGVLPRECADAQAGLESFRAVLRVLKSLESGGYEVLARINYVDERARELTYSVREFFGICLEETTRASNCRRRVERERERLDEAIIGLQTELSKWQVSGSPTISQSNWKN